MFSSLDMNPPPLSLESPHTSTALQSKVEEKPGKTTKFEGFIKHDELNFEEPAIKILLQEASKW